MVGPFYGGHCVLVGCDLVGLQDPGRWLYSPVSVPPGWACSFFMFIFYCGVFASFPMGINSVLNMVGLWGIKMHHDGVKS